MELLNDGQIEIIFIIRCPLYIRVEKLSFFKGCESIAKSTFWGINFLVHRLPLKVCPLLEVSL